MSEKFLRNKVDGFIYRWNDYLAKNPKCEIITEQQAFPERFMDTKMVNKVRKKQKETQFALDLSVLDIPEAPVGAAPELRKEASKGVSK